MSGPVATAATRRATRPPAPLRADYSAQRAYTRPLHITVQAQLSIGREWAYITLYTCDVACVAPTCAFIPLCTTRVRILSPGLYNEPVESRLSIPPRSTRVVPPFSSLRSADLSSVTKPWFSATDAR